MYIIIPPFRDHPRRCGENAHVRRQCGIITGSPPQVRGKHALAAGCRLRYGITPAGAGKTFLRSILPPLWADHPRRCGENRPTFAAPLSSSGSPPQVRGKHRTAVANNNQIGITPAGAGKTFILDEGAAIAQDHPRRCGENKAPFSGVFGQPGSPPQVRGKLQRAYTQGSKCRITPAGAGKTL